MGLVLWDFDGTLAERPGMWRGCLVEALDEHASGHDVSADALIPYLREGFPWHRPDQPHLDLCTPEAWWEAVGLVLARAYEAVGIPAERAAELAVLARRRYVDPSWWRVFGDTVATLGRLRQHGWRHVILSNHVPELGALVDRLGLARFLEEVVCSAVIGYEKPHPEAFAGALRSRRKGEPAWMVGDNAVADVAGARRAGLRAVRVRTNGVSLEAAADPILAS